MATASIDAPKSTLRGNRELNRKVKELATGDNITNFLHLAKVYAILAATVAGIVWLHGALQGQAYGWAWLLPAYLAAVFVIGASQHQLAGAGHEGSHHSLFKNRKLNELASDLLCMFPLFSTTFQFRLYHLQHHQFVNDPKRDPDFAMLDLSGHWMEFPVTKKEFTAMLWRQALVFPLVRHLLARARFNAFGTPETSPYRADPNPKEKFSSATGFLYFVALLVVAYLAKRTGSPAVAVFGTLGAWVAAVAVFLSLPDVCFPRTKLKPVIPRRTQALLRSGYFALLFGSIALVQAWSGYPAMRAFFLLWIVPLATTFPLFLMLRQIVQHGNADRGFLTNTRVFHVNPLLRYAIFPFGMDYHLPHHMYATVPHFRLPDLHRLLGDNPEYAAACVETENYIHPAEKEPRRPTVVEVLGPEYATTGEAEAFIDETVLDGVDSENLELLREAGREAREDAAPSDSGATPRE